MDIKLTKNEYNFVFGFLSQGLSGHAGSAVVAHKLIEQIQGKADQARLNRWNWQSSCMSWSRLLKALCI